MWKRPDEDPSAPATSPGPVVTAGGSPSPPPQPGRVAVIGRSITIEGKLMGEEDLLIEGRFQGEIRVPGHQVTIGAQGRVEAEVRASAIVVEGEVRGNLAAERSVQVKSSGKVQGDIKAPRVALDQGCRFKGAIDMEPGRADAATERKAPTRAEPPAAAEAAKPGEAPAVRRSVG
ncbi:MAG TPA: polymer-forming cytoskeletal protein [Thermoanaerobaculia bacterium]|nr:polymer-forming cytoskeletal protein [Thermoanaerobaculia bacterium]